MSVRDASDPRTVRLAPGDTMAVALIARVEKLIQ